MDELFSYEIHEIACGSEVAGTEDFTIGADTPFVGAIVAGIIGGVVGAAIGEVLDQAA